MQMARIGLIATLWILASVQGVAQDIAQDAETPPLNLAGVGLLVAYPPGGASDPYSGPMAVKVFYQRDGLPFGFSAGASAALTAYYPRNADYGQSGMMTWTIELLYPIGLDLEYRSRIRLTPSLGAGMYHRWFMFDGSWQYASRWVMGASFAIDLVLDSGLTLGFAMGGTLFFDNVVRFTGGLGERVGVMF